MSENSRYRKVTLPKFTKDGRWSLQEPGGCLLPALLCCGNPLAAAAGRDPVLFSGQLYLAFQPLDFRLKFSGFLIVKAVLPIQLRSSISFKINVCEVAAVSWITFWTICLSVQLPSLQHELAAEADIAPTESIPIANAIPTIVSFFILSPFSGLCFCCFLC